MTGRVLLGIDPGIADTGYGVILISDGREHCLDYGSIRTSASLPVAERLRIVYDELAKIIGRHRPKEAALEKLFFQTNVKTAMVVAEARGVIRLCLANHGVPYREFGPGEVKTAVCGHGAAAKPQMQKMVQRLLRLSDMPKSDDAADALAIALTLANTVDLTARNSQLYS